MKLFLALWIFSINIACSASFMQVGEDGLLTPFPEGKASTRNKIVRSLKRELVQESTTVTCSLSNDQIEAALGILDNTMGYLKGSIKSFSVARREEGPDLFPQSLISDDNRIKLIEILFLSFQDNLLYLSNVVRMLLLDEDKKDVVYRNLIREIAGVNRWFDDFIVINECYKKDIDTLRSIFKELGGIFPSNNGHLDALFSIVSGDTTIEKIDKVYDEMASSIDEAERKAMAQLQSSGKRNKRDFVCELNEKIKEIIEDKIIQIKLYDLVDPYTKRKKYGPNWRERFLKHHDCSQLNITEAVLETNNSDSNDLSDDDISTGLEGVVGPLVEAAQTMEGLSATAMPASVALPFVEATIDVEKIVDPRAFHDECQAFKQAKGASGASQPILDTSHPSAQRFYGFLSDCIYGKSTFSWLDFKREFQRVGFRIDGAGNGNVRQISLGHKKFTVHRPNKEKDSVPYSYIHYIQTGLSHVFGLTEERVQLLIEKKGDS